MLNSVLLCLFLSFQVFLSPGQNFSAFIAFASIFIFAKYDKPVLLLLSIVGVGIVLFIFSSQYRADIGVSIFLKNLLSYEKTLSLFLISIVFMVVLTRVTPTLANLLTTIVVVGLIEYSSIALLMRFKEDLSYLDFAYPGIDYKRMQEDFIQFIAADKKDQARVLMGAVMRQIGALNLISNILYFLVLLGLFGKRVLGYQSPFLLLRFANGLISLFFMGWGILLMGNYLGNKGVMELAIGVLIVTGFLYFLQGCAILFFRYQNIGVGEGSRKRKVVWLLGIFLAFFIPFLFRVPLGVPLSIGILVIFSMGLLDQWVNYRRLV